jgi:hypothetical protein
MTLEACTIELWRGYRTMRFYAADAEGAALLESQPFRFKGNGVPPDEQEPREAYARVLATLEADGWVPDGVDYGRWYSTRLVRARGEHVVITPLSAPRPSTAYEAPAPPTWQSAAEVSSTAVAAEPEPSSQPEPSSPAAEPRRRRRPSLLVITFGAGAALTIGGLLAGGAEGFGAIGTHHTKAPQATRPAATPRVVWTGASAPATPTLQKQVSITPAYGAKAQAPVRISITAKQSSWLEIRDRSATGRVLYSGQLAAGRKLHFQGTRLWSRFGAAGHLTITANGRPVTLAGTFVHLFVGA